MTPEMENRIREIVSEIVRDALENQTHNGVDSQKLLGSSIVNAPQSALTSASVGSLSSGGANNLKTADSTILTNAILRISEMESRLRRLNFFN